MGNQSVSLKYLGFESLTGQAKHNQMTKLEQPGSQFGHGMIFDILEYDIKAGALATCSYNTTENSANCEWLPLPSLESRPSLSRSAGCIASPLPWLQLEMNKVKSYPIARSTMQICIRLRPLSSSHTALPRFRGSDLRSALMTTLTCYNYGKRSTTWCLSMRMHWVVAMQDHTQISIYNIYTPSQFLVYLGLAQARPELVCVALVNYIISIEYCHFSVKRGWSMYIHLRIFLRYN